MKAVLPPVNGLAPRPNARFEEFKGRLAFPLEGNIVRAQKFLKLDNFRLSKGIFIEASGSTDVRAVFPGKVEFSGKLKGYGEIIIINHGSRFFTISAFLSRRLKEMGDEVGMGDLIGTAGKGGAEGVYLLYFEIREGEKSLDPVEWLKRA
jgi:septal ring factor EnvC (AmiA/AmiB activator)